MQQMSDCSEKVDAMRRWHGIAKPLFHHFLRRIISILLWVVLTAVRLMKPFRIDIIMYTRTPAAQDPY